MCETVYRKNKMNNKFRTGRTSENISLKNGAKSMDSFRKNRSNPGQIDLER